VGDGKGKGKGKEGEGEDPDGMTPALRARMQQMEKKQQETDKQLLVEQTARKDAETKQKLEAKQGAIRRELNALEYASPEAAEDAFLLVNGKVEEDADGNYIAEGLPLSDFVKTYLPEKKPHLLAPINKSGSGASGTGTPGIKAKKTQLEDVSAANLLKQNPTTGAWEFDQEKGRRMAQDIRTALR
jgi:hypothetical protein